MLVISGFLILLISGTSYDYCARIVKTIYGKLEGVVKTTRHNRTYVSFAGIPFAKPPVGDLRFANPQKPERWDGVRNCSESRPRCIQRNYLFYNVPPIEGSEDCLYLNVYVPVKNGLRLKNLPVLVSIPWGGFLAEGGDEGYFGPEYLLDYDVILVSLNYRVGIFGFLSTLDDAAPGNLGLKDQVLALQWVQGNIEYFGGLKENVTIMGQSAGAFSSHLHMLSPASRGLFSKAISQSGTALSAMSTPNNETQRFDLPVQAQLVNCSDSIENSTELIQCLRNISAEVLLQTQDAFKTFYRFPLTVWPLVIENKSEKNPNPFLEKTPLEYIRAKEFQKVPWLVGNVKNEGVAIISAIFGVAQERKDLNSSFSSVLTDILGLSGLTNDTENLYQRISHQYLGDKNYISDDYEWQQGFINLWSDILLIASTNKSVSLQVANGLDTIYLYSFEYAGEYTTASAWSTGYELYNPNWTICHCDDLLYLFRLHELFENQLTSKSDEKVSDVLLSLWVNFAKYGNPNQPEHLILEDINWEPLKASSNGILLNEDIKLLNITGSYKTKANFNITRGFYEERMAFWQNEVPDL